jgi:hypothetical protein
MDMTIANVLSPWCMACLPCVSKAYGILARPVSHPHSAGFDSLAKSHEVPALAIGVILGPIAAKFLDPERWGSSAPGQEPTITLGVMRVMIGIQLYVGLLFLSFDGLLHRLLPIQIPCNW